MYQAFVHQYDGDRPAVAKVCEQLLGLSSHYGLPAVEAYAALLDCWARGDAGTPTAILQRLQAMGCLLGHTYFTTLNAQQAQDERDFGRALSLLDACLAQAELGGERYCVPEALRRKAALLLECGGAAAQPQARELLQQARAQAQEMGMRLSAREALRQLEALPEAGP
jgi:hypothetical protein